MLMKNFILVSLSFLMLYACKEDINEGPTLKQSCIEQLKTELQDKPMLNPPAFITQWQVDGETYYYVPSGCCDQFNYLYNSNCEKVCAPDGGFTGNGDGNCPEFSGEIVKELIWMDERVISGTWLLKELLLDPGDGSGVFEPVVSEKNMVFELNGVLESNGDVCQSTATQDNSSSAIYSIIDNTISNDNCTITFTYNDSVMIINYSCFEPCKGKFVKQ
ncbi:MAG: hypothetical protein ACJAUV_000238 [Flavobacteriales bacterium]|jgi:hypothetical protein